MKYRQIIIIALFVSCVSVLKAQDTIIENLLAGRPFEGTITMTISPEVKALIGQKSAGGTATSEYQKTSGYRIQVYSGNAPRTSKAEAFRHQELLNETFPDISTYVTYTAPYWRLRVGDFRTHEEAFLFMQQITQEMPSLKKESYVVKDEVRIQLNN